MLLNLNGKKMMSLALKLKLRMMKCHIPHREKKQVCLPCHKTFWIISKFMTNSQDRGLAVQR